MINRWTVAILLALGGSAHAQVMDESRSRDGNPQEGLEEVIVTGTHIRRSSDAHLSSPVETISQEELVRTPRATLGDFIVEATINSGSFSSGEKTSQSDATAIGFNLRGLGPGSTLVLINGQRQAAHPQPDNQNFLKVDVNALMPSIMLERLEILKDGAAAVYGSDAVAGVANFITRDQFEGAEIRTTWQKTEVDGKDDYDLQAIWGQQGDRGGVVAAIQYQNREPSYMDEMFPVSRFNEYEALSGFSLPATYILDGGNGVIAPDPLCGDPRIDEAADARAPSEINRPVSILDGNRCRKPFSLGRGYGSDELRFNGFLRGHFDVTENLATHVEAAFNRTDIHRDSVPTPAGFPRASLEDSLVPASHPGNPFGEDVVLSSSRLDFNGSPWRAPGAKIGTKTEAHVVRLNTGFDWDLFDERVGLAFDVTYSSVDEDLLEGDSIRGRTGLALAGLGGPNCDPTTGQPGIGDCMYWNPFANALLAQPGDPTYNDPEVVNWITPADVYKNGSSELTTADIGVSADLFDLPAGTVSGVLGFQYRDYYWALEKDVFSNDGLLVGAGVNPDAEGTSSVNSAYFEVAIPLIQTFELSVAGRYEDFGGGVDSFDPRVGLVFEPIDNLIIRATYSTAFRTASLNQLFSTQVGGNNIILEDGSTTTVGTNFVGNPDVDPETSDSVNFGVEYSWDGFDLAVDLWSIDFEDIVGTLEPQAFFDANPNSPLIVYDNNGIPLDITLPITNLSSIKTSGVDLVFSYSTDLGRLGLLDIDTMTTYVNRYDIQTVPGGPVTDGVGLRHFGSNFAVPMPEWRGNYRAMLSFGNNHAYQASLTGRFVDSVFDPDRPTPEESFFPVDFQFSATLDDQIPVVGSLGPTFVVSFSINNMFDEAPPPIFNDNITFEDRLYDGYGRQYVLGLSWSFE